MFWLRLAEQSLGLSWVESYWIEKDSRRLGCSSKRGGSIAAPLETRRCGSTPGLEDLLLAHARVPSH